MTGEQQRRLNREREQAMVDAALRIAGNSPPIRDCDQKPKPGANFSGPLNPPMVAEQLLVVRGWQRTGLVTRQDHVHQITWWRKANHEFPQHLALWLESHNVNRAWWPA